MELIETKRTKDLDIAYWLGWCDEARDYTGFVTAFGTFACRPLCCIMLRCEDDWFFKPSSLDPVAIAYKPLPLDEWQSSALMAWHMAAIKKYNSDYEIKRQLLEGLDRHKGK